jgi:uncharacterized protein
MNPNRTKKDGIMSNTRKNLPVGSQEVRRLTTPRFEVRDAGGALRLTGYASTTGQQYNMGSYTEQIAPGAFRKTLASKPTVVLLANHDGLPYASTRNGSMLLSEDSHGLRFDATLDQSDTDSQALVRKVRSGLLSECSFAFRVVRQSWSSDGELRTIEEVDMSRGADVSVCTYGANPSTSVEALALRKMREKALGLLDLYRARAYALKLQGKR